MDVAGSEKKTKGKEGEKRKKINGESRAKVAKGLLWWALKNWKAYMIQKSA